MIVCHLFKAYCALSIVSTRFHYDPAPVGTLHHSSFVMVTSQHIHIDNHALNSIIPNGIYAFARRVPPPQENSLKKPLLAK